MENGPDTIPEKIPLNEKQWDAVRQQHDKGEITFTRGDSTVEQDQKAETAAAPSPDKSAEEKVPETPKKNPFEINIVDIKDLAESQARDRADARMTESKEDRSGNWFKRTANRVWKHNLAKEYYRQKEIKQAREEVYKTGKLFDGDAEAKAAIVERFAAAYDDEQKQELLKEGETISPENEQLNRQIKTLINEHAAKPMSQEVFQEERNRILRQHTSGTGKEGEIYADNLFKVAEEVRKAIEHGQKIEELNLNVNVKLGKAKEALNTKAKQEGVDKFVEWAQNSKLGKYLGNEAVAAGAVYSIATGLFQKTLRSKAAQIATFGGAAAASAAVAGFKESARMERERAQHGREMAKGMKFEKDARRRNEFEKVNYETASAAGSILTLKQSLSALESKQIDPSVVLNDLADIESRIALGEKNKIDLMRYSDPASVERERTDLLLARAKLKTALKKELGEEQFKSMLAEKVSGFSEELTKGDKGIEAQDKAFKKLKRTNIAKQVGKTLLIGTATGLVAQEVGSAFKQEDGFFQGLFKHFKGRQDTLQQDATVLETVRRYVSSETPRMPMGHETLMAIHNPFHGSDYNMRLPEGIKLADHGNGTFDVVRNGQTLVSGVHAFKPNGEIDPELKFALLKHDIVAGNPATVGGSAETAGDYLRDHQGSTHVVHRELHYNNDTRATDYNEAETKWGGVGKVVSHDHFGHVAGTEGTGIDAQGNYVLNIGHMTPEGSFQDQYGQHFSVDAQKAMKEGNLKMIFSLSRDTQGHVFDIKIGPDGNAIIPKDSEIAKLMFENHNGHAVFTGKYAEVSQSMGYRPDGSENVRILSTVVSHGHENVTTPGIPVSRLDVPGVTNTEVPPFIPIVPRTPLEKALDPGKREATKVIGPDKAGEKKAEDKKTEGKPEAANIKKENAGKKEKKADADVMDSIYDKQKGGFSETQEEVAAAKAESYKVSKENMYNPANTIVGYNHIRQDLEKIASLRSQGKSINDIKDTDLLSPYSKQVLSEMKNSPEKNKKSMDTLSAKMAGTLKSSRIGEIRKGIEKDISTGKRKLTDLSDTEYSLYTSTTPKFEIPELSPNAKKVINKEQVTPGIEVAIDRLALKNIQGIEPNEYEKNLALRFPEELKDREDFLKQQESPSVTQENVESSNAPAPENLPIGQSQLEGNGQEAEPVSKLENPVISDIEKIEDLINSGKNISSLKRSDLVSAEAQELYDQVKESKAKGNKLKLLVDQLQNPESSSAPESKEPLALSDEEIWKKYLTYEDTPFAEQILEQEGPKVHAEDGSFNTPTQNSIDQIKRVLESGKEEAFERATAKVLFYNKDVLESLGITPSPYATSRTSGYGGIIEQLYTADHPEHAQPGDSVADPLGWEEKNGESLRALQNVADQLVAEELVSDESTKKAILNRIDNNKPGAARIRQLLSQKASLPKPQLVELGKLVRQNQGIKDIKK
jgi:hypothetical protein